MRQTGTMGAQTSKSEPEISQGATTETIANAPVPSNEEEDDEPDEW